ncbi:hypothetical protein CERSUDRAFT_87418 [Gelatoporia subvermispora B]|uniref:Uncharacterized protein n=1 Tax=Ceriporiopsis subvermispora (strain B) TaxID=914234 RepID=M2PBV0_CERS8|nr:hypothetical protein CERSUDRAFT_87418 [Gelatoporia subvermispora B]
MCVLRRARLGPGARCDLRAPVRGPSSPVGHPRCYAGRRLTPHINARPPEPGRHRAS